MLKEIPDLSKFVVVVASVLYVLGFLCVTGYLARFGIVTFDIVNARFLIAGIHVAIPLAISLYLGWNLYSLVLKDEFPRHYVARWNFYFQFLFIPIAIGGVLDGVYRLAKHVPPAQASAFHFTPWSIGLKPIADLLSDWDLSSSPDGEFILKYTIYFAAHFCILVAFFALLWFAFEPGIKNLFGRLVTPAGAKQQQAATVQGSAPTSNNTVLGVLSWIGMRWIDVIAVALIVILGFYAAVKLKTELFDVSSLASRQPNSSPVTAVWVYATSSAMFLFFWTFGIRPDQPVFESLQKLFAPMMLADVAQRSAIPLIGAVFLFGATVFPRIPFAIGGGEPREVHIQITDPDLAGATGRFFLLGESAQFIFIVRVAEGGAAQAFQVSKDKIAWIMTRDDAPVPLPRAKPTMPAQ